MSIESSSLKFSGHQTFPLRYGWIYKIIQEIANGTSISSANTVENQMISMGVGKNMVLSIRHWIKTIGLVIDSCDNSRDVELTAVAKALFVDDGERKAFDTFMDKIGTVWILHWLAQTIPVSNAELNTARWFFNYFNGVRTDKQQIAQDIKLSLIHHDRELNEATLKKDIDCFYQTYTFRTAIPGKSSEDSFTSPFAELGLLRQLDSKHFISELSDRKSLPDEVFVYALIDYIQRKQLDREGNVISKELTFSFESLLTGIGSPGRVFRLSASGLSEKLDAAEQITNGKLAWTDTQGLRQLQQNFDCIHTVNSINYLETYYQR
ncbi:DUF4007 family protein [Vibrio harveyi]|uniref:DUF4007 family protein n=1 Tax=Vibrio harveyi TaxID=669 RepID=UPI002480D28E|nr:DUF4007 family protein [Vibrio harveyi]